MSFTYNHLRIDTEASAMCIVNYFWFLGDASVIDKMEPLRPPDCWYPSVSFLRDDLPDVVSGSLFLSFDSPVEFPGRGRVSSLSERKGEIDVNTNTLHRKEHAKTVIDIVPELNGMYLIGNPLESGGIRLMQERAIIDKRILAFTFFDSGVPLIPQLPRLYMGFGPGRVPFFHVTCDGLSPEGYACSMGITVSTLRQEKSLIVPFTGIIGFDELVFEPHDLSPCIIHVELNPLWTEEGMEHQSALHFYWSL